MRSFNFGSIPQATRKVSRFNATLFKCRSDIGDVSTSTASLRTAFGSKPTKALSADIERRRRRDLADALGREIFSRLYDEAPVLERPAAGTELLQKCHAMIDSMDEFKTLREQVKGDPDMSALAAAKVIDSIAKAVPEIAKEEQKQREEKLPKSRSERRRTRGPKADPDGALRRSMRKAATEAAGVAAEVQNGLNGIKPGLGSAPPIHEHDQTARMHLAQKVSSDPRLQKIMRIAGRLQRQSEQSKMSKSDNGSTCLVGVELGDDLTRVLPSELAFMRPNSKLRLLTLARFAEKRLQQYQMSGEEPQGRGPIVILLDESGSMRGEPSEWASAIALACIGISSREKRSCTIIGFTGNIRYIVQLDEHGCAWQHPTARNTLVKREKLGAGTAADVALHVATSEPFGGTNFNRAFKAALNMKDDGVLSKRADLILITDGQADCRRDMLEEIAEAKSDGDLRVYGMTVGGGSLGEAVRQLCDRTIDLDEAIRTNDKGARIASALP